MKAKRPYIVALMFIAALILFVWGFNFLKGKDVFSRERIFYAKYREVNGLVRSNPIVINGLRVGQVRDLYFNPSMNGDIIIELSIRNKFPIPKNSIAHIFSSDLMGSKAIDLQLGNGSELLEDGDTLATSIEASLMDEVNAQVAPLKNKAEGLLSSVDSLVVVMQTILNENAKENILSSLQNISNTFKNLESTTSNIDSMVVNQRTRIASVLYNVDEITKNFQQNSDNLNRIMSNTAKFSDSLAVADIAGTLRKADASLSALQQLLEKMNNGQGSMGQLMNNDSLYIELQKSAADLNKLLEDIRLNPKKYVRFSVF